MEKKPTSFLSVILWGITAAIWVLNSLFDLISHSSDLLVLINLICAFVCCYAFINSLIRYKEDKNQ